MNLFLYASAIALSWAFEGFLSPAFILNLMQFPMHLSVEMMPCQIAFLFSDFVFHRSREDANILKSPMLIISFPSNFTANFLMIALPMLLTRVLYGSMVEVNSMLKLRFAVSRIMTSSLPKFGNLTSSS